MVAAFLVAQLSALLSAQTEWQMRIWGGRYGHALAYDSARGRAVLFGGVYGSGTWEWDGNAWTERTPAASPPARAYHALAYDSARGRVVLFGGYGFSSYLSDTWEWDGNTWTQRTPAASLPARGYHSLAYDSARGRVVLFGGSNGSLYFSDTWEWDGNAWTQRTPAASPSSRYSHALAYDTVRSRVVLFGGYDNHAISYVSDTWEWDGSAWTQRTPLTSPPARAGHALAYDNARGRVVLFGSVSDTWEWDGNVWTLRTSVPSPRARWGHALAYDSARGQVVLFGGDDGQFALSDTWEWDGNAWTQRTPGTPAPFFRHGHGLAYDSARRRVVLFGGADADGLTFSDTWEWDGNVWTQRTPATSPPARGGFLAYDSARGKVVVFGGGNIEYRVIYSDTWEYGPITSASYAAFGTGCTGSLGVTHLAATALPWLGQRMVVHLDNLPLGVAIMVNGFNNTTSSLGPLPVSLAAFGMPGCLARISIDTSLFITGAGNAADYSCFLPSSSGLLGLTFYEQALVPDPGRNAAGWVVSDAAAATIGGL